MDKRLEREMELYGVKSPNVISMKRNKGIVVFITENKNKSSKDEIIFKDNGELLRYPASEINFILSLQH